MRKIYNRGTLMQSFTTLPPATNIGIAIVAFDDVVFAAVATATTGATTIDSIVVDAIAMVRSLNGATRDNAPKTRAGKHGDRSHSITKIRAESGVMGKNDYCYNGTGDRRIFLA